MLWFRQLQLIFDTRKNEVSIHDRAAAVVKRAPIRPSPSEESTGALDRPRPRGRDGHLEVTACELLRAFGAFSIADKIRVEWNPRLRTCAGRADWTRSLISLNPRLHEHGVAEIDRTLRHELAHLLAQFRAGRRRIAPHGRQWRQACVDLGITDETRCHALPFPVKRRSRPYHYRCTQCGLDFRRVRRIRRVVACLACCRKHNGGKFDARFRLELVVT